MTAQGKYESMPVIVEEAERLIIALDTAYASQEAPAVGEGGQA
jgi:hypothetical protein